jgi:hypothetical protein
LHSERRSARARSRVHELQESLEHSRERVGVRADDLQRVVGAALARAGSSLAKARAETVGDVTTPSISILHKVVVRAFLTSDRRHIRLTKSDG